MADWLTDCHSDWLTDWLTDWQTDWLRDQNIYGKLLTSLSENIPQHTQLFSFLSFLTHWLPERFAKNAFLDNLEIFSLEMGQISSDPRSFPPAELQYRRYQFWSKVMTSEEEERPTLDTAGYGQQGSQWCHVCSAKLSSPDSTWVSGHERDLGSLVILSTLSGVVTQSLFPQEVRWGGVRDKP